MSDKRDKIERALARLAAAFNPPEVTDADEFRAEFRTALQHLAEEALIEGVSSVIANRKAKSFPSIGEIRSACLETIPKARSEAAQAYHDAERRQGERRDHFVGQLRIHPHLDWMIEKGVHVRALEFAMEHDRLPNAFDWREMKADIDKVQAHLDEATGPNPHAFITKMAEAVLYRREKFAEELKPGLKEAAV